MDTIQDRSHAPASQGGQPVIPTDRHHNAGDAPALQAVTQLLESSGVGGEPGEKEECDTGEIGVGFGRRPSTGAFKEGRNP